MENPDPITMDQEKETDTPDTISVTDQTPSRNEFLTGLKLYLTLGSVTMVGFLISLDASIIVTAIPRITAHFHSIADIGWYGSAYMIANCACQLNTAKIYQHHSLKITFLVFLSIFELGSLICGVATSSVMFIIGRAIAGIGGSGLLNGGFTVIATVSPIPKRPLYIAIVYSVSIIGLVAGPLLGGIITQYASWRWCFYINLPIGGLAALNIVFTKWPARESENTTLSYWDKFKRLDPVGFLVFAPTCVMLLLALQWGGVKYAWNSATTIGLFCGTLGSLCAFIAWESRSGDKAMMPISLLRRRIVYSSCIATVFQFGVVQLTAYYLPIWFQVIKGASPSMSGVYFMGTIGSQIITGLLSGILVSKLGYYLPWSVGGNAVGAIGSGLLSTLKVSSAAGRYIGYQIIGGVGRGACGQQPMIAVQAAVPASQVSLGTGLVIFSQFFGGAIFVAFGQTTFTNSLGSALKMFAPGVDAEFVIHVGATSLRDSVPASALHGVLMAYNQALMHTLYLAAAANATAFFASWGMGWVNMKKVKQVESKV